MKCFIISIVSLISIGQPLDAFAEEISGQVKVFGNAGSKTVKLVKPGEYDGPSLCSNDLATKISSISNMQLMVEGEWGEMGKKKIKCMEASAFKVLTTSTGRPAVVGIIEKSDRGFELRDNEGKTYEFKKLPKGLKSMVGKKVIVGLKQMNSPNSLTSSHKVVSYTVYP